MAYIYGETNDGYISSGNQSTFIAARSHGGDSYNSNAVRGPVAYMLARPGRGGGEINNIIRSFYEFDTTSLSVAPTEANLELYGFSVGNADVIAVRSEQSASLGAGDFDALYGASSQLAASDGAGTGTLASVSGLTYSAEIATWSTTAYNTIPLNATALADIASLDRFKVCVMGYDYDYLDIVAPISPITDLVTVAWFADSSGTSSDPKLSYAAGTAAVADNATFFGTNF
jgi:hypothetical protein